MKHFLLLLFFLPLFGQSQTNSAWFQIGLEIHGEDIYDHSGYSVSINDSGNIIAIGSPDNDGNGSNSGHVRIYNWNGTSWNQIGQDIDGEAYEDHSGRSVSLSALAQRLPHVVCLHRRRRGQEGPTTGALSWRRRPLSSQGDST